MWAGSWWCPGTSTTTGGTPPTSPSSGRTGTCPSTSGSSGQQKPLVTFLPVIETHLYKAPCTRHLFKPMVMCGFSRRSAIFAVFLVSSFLHEYLVSVPLRMFKVSSGILNEPTERTRRKIYWTYTCRTILTHKTYWARRTYWAYRTDWNANFNR